MWAGSDHARIWLQASPAKDAQIKLKWNAIGESLSKYADELFDSSLTEIVLKPKRSGIRIDQGLAPRNSVRG